ncbi:MAG TPA: amidase family protein [Povalibacter sp.]|uniref:amidase family protein n=1 Tax=Povalibacter sp. TaxID=1962978 RepID=UPI002C59D3E5|nr:amidase family protein [Povalibacter sp.]HMN43703.1 amidase family protein [Povalibacter sp.]
MNLRRSASGLAACALGMALSVLAPAWAQAASFDLSTATIADIQAAMEEGSLTSERLVQMYLARIEAYDQKGPKLNSILTLNRNALAEARVLDLERKEKGPRSSLHGIVVLAKDVFDTYDMPTTGGFKPMATSQPSRDAFVIDRLRKSGAIILGKLNQSDWYGVAPSGGSTLGGQPTSPYNPKKMTGGSSSGTGVSMAAWLGTVGLGSDTSGSIVIPTTLNNLVGFSTTHGLVSRTGMMWSSPRQESGGPMCRSVYDCAAVLDVIAGYDPADLATEAGLGKIPSQSYTSFVAPTGLKGARIGVLREMVRAGPKHTEGVALFEKAIADFKAAGALIVDPVLTGINLPAALSDAGAATYERADAINKYLADLPPTAPIRTVEEMIAKGGALVKPAIVTAAQIGSLDHHPQLVAAYRQQDMLRAAMIEVMDKYQLDAVILPYRTVLTDDRPTAPNPAGGGGSSGEAANPLASYTGLPTIIVPGGFFASDGMPFGVQFLGKPFAEPLLIKVASGYEAATHHRKAPALTPPLAGERFDYPLAATGGHE